MTFINKEEKWAPEFKAGRDRVNPFVQMKLGL